MPGIQRATTPAADLQPPAAAPPTKVSDAPVHPLAQAQGAGGNRAVAATLLPNQAPAAASGKNPADRQIRTIVLKKVKQVLEYQMADGSTVSERVLWYVDFPPGSYIARALHDRPLHWAPPPQLRVYVDEGGRGEGVQTDPTDRVKNTATFEGVDDFDFVVVGARVLPDGGAGDVSDQLGSAEIRRYLSLRTRRRGLPVRARPDAELPVEQAAALMQLRQELSDFTEADWALLARHGPRFGPMGTWTEALEQFDRYLHSSERAAELSAGAERDARIQAARAEIDPKREAAAISRLKGAEKLYEAIVESEFTTSENSTASVEAKAFQKLLNRLKTSRFHSVAEFDAAARELREMVRRQAVVHALMGLKEGERVLNAELQRYRNMSEVNKLAGALRPLKEGPEKGRPVEAGAPEAIRVRTGYPLLRDEVVYYGAAVSNYPENLQELLLQNIEGQFGNVAKSRKALQDDSDLVLSFDLVIAETLEAMGLPKETVQAQLIRDRRGVKPSAMTVLDALQPILMVLSFAAGPLGWVAYAANLASLGIGVTRAYQNERQRDLVRSAGHAGRQLASEQRIHGVLEGIESIMEPLGIAGGLLGVFVLPEPFVPGAHVPDVPAPELLPPERPALEPRAPEAAEPPGGPAQRLLPAGEGGALEIPEAGPQVSSPEPGVIEIVHSNQRGKLRITRDGFEVYLDPASSKPTFARKWGDHNLSVPPRVLEQYPHLAGLRDIDRVTLGGRPFGIGVSPDGWFVFAPGTRNPLITGRFGSRTGLGGGAQRLLGSDRVRAYRSGFERVPDFTNPARNVRVVPRRLRGADEVPSLPVPPDGFVITLPAELTAEEIEAARSSGRVFKLRVEIEGPNGTHGFIERSWAPKTDTLSYVESEFGKNLPRWVDTDPPLVPGKGTPLETYLTMALMNWLKARGARFTGRRLVRIEGVYNKSSVAQLAWAKMHGASQEEALLATKTVQYAENSIIQSGGKIVKAEITNHPFTLPWRDFVKEAKPNELDELEKLSFKLPPDLRVEYAYDVELTVDSAVPRSQPPSDQ
jgi:hypothetical protein